MKYYMIEFTAWTSGRESGHPYRTRTTGTNKIEMIRKLKDITARANVWHGYEAPLWFEMEGGEVPVHEALEALEAYDRNKVIGGGI